MFMNKCLANCSTQKMTDYAWLAIRIALAVVLVLHGYQKLAGGMEMFTGMLDKLGFPLPALMAWIVALLEFFGGLAIAIGLWTRDVAALVAIQFAVILLFVKNVFVFGSANGFPGADIDLVIFGAAIALALAGAGRISLDAKLKKA